MPLLARAHLTPIFPNATTSINGDTEVILKWIYYPDNATSDAFESQRALCDLMWGDSGYRVALLAENVNPYDKELKVFIRADYGFNSSQYYIRYRSNNQKGIVYSDRFSLFGMDGPDLSAFMTSHGSGGAVVGTSQAQPSPSVSHYTTVSRPTGTSTATQRLSSLGANSAVSSSPQADQPVGPFAMLPSPTSSAPAQTSALEVSSNGVSAMSLTRQRDSAWKKVSMLLWPVLVGAAMAM